MLARRAAGIAGAHWLSRASQAAPFRALGGRERGFIGPERRGQRRKRRQLRRTLACEHEAVIAPAAAAELVGRAMEFFAFQSSGGRTRKRRVRAWISSACAG